MSGYSSSDERPAIEAVAAFLRDVPEIVTPQIRHAASRILLNGLRASLAASGEPILEKMRQTKASRAQGVESGCGVLFSGCQLPLEDAALCNQQQWLYFLLDDMEPRSGIHPGGPAITAALAVAEQSQHEGRAVSGQQLLNAVVAGIELQVAVALAGAPEMLLERGFAPLSALSPLGAAAAACVVDDVAEPVAAHAIGMAAMSGIGMWEMGGSSSAGFLTALGMRSGLAAWHAAQVGFEGPKGAIDGKFGAFRAYTGKPVDVIRRELETLGSTWSTPGILFQPYSGDTFTQAPLVALKALRDSVPEPGQLGPVAKIDVYVSERTANGVAHKTARHAKVPDELAFNSDPKSRLAAAWLQANYSFDQGFAQLIGDSTIEDLRSKVDFISDPEIAEISSARVEISFADGKQLRSETISFPGSADNPMSDRDLEDAFREVADHKLTTSRCDRIINGIWALEDSDDISSLLADIMASTDG